MNCRKVFHRYFSSFFLVIFALALFSNSLLFGNDLEILPGDAYVEFSEDDKGFHLYIKAKLGLQSILITESSSDPKKNIDSFALRSWDYNPVNGDERRVLNGQFLESKPALYFLLDSSVEKNDFWGSAYHIYIPFHLTYGYPWSREGQWEVHQGTWLNIRAFELPYADYAGQWQDNPFVLSMKELPLAPDPNPQKGEDFVRDIQEAMQRIASVISDSHGDTDLVLVVDSTVSMKDNLNFLRHSLVPLVRQEVKSTERLRVGLVLYRDYKEAYLTRSKPFTHDLDELQQHLNEISVSGGRDRNEAVHEGLYAALTEFDWQATEKIIIQLGDAPAHKEPRGVINAAMVKDQALKLGVLIYPIQLSH